MFAIFDSWTPLGDDLMKKFTPQTCPGLSNFLRPKPEYLYCPNCGERVEIWTDEDETICDNCGAKVTRKQASCLTYCEYAEKCLEIIRQKRKDFKFKQKSGD